MKISILIPAFLLMGTVVHAQSVVISQQVIGSLGASFSGAQKVDATVGESVISTGHADDFSVTQGFHQPKRRNLLQVEVTTYPESCKGAADGRAVIDTIFGCEPVTNVQWSNGSSGNTVSGLSAGNYIVEIVAGSCQSEFTVVIDLQSEEECEYELEFYSGITPNGDHDNDYWHIENIHLPRYIENRVSIFNRWGTEVFSASGYNNDSVRWDGSGRNQGDLPDGTYFYVVEVNGKTHKGYIELTR